MNDNPMIYLSMKQLVTLAALALLSANVFSDDSLTTRELLGKHGKDAIVKAVIEYCGGEVTIKQFREMRKTIGRPRLDLVDEETLNADFQDCSVNPSYIDGRIKRKKRAQEDKENTVIAYGKKVDLRNIDPLFDQVMARIMIRDVQPMAGEFGRRIGLRVATARQQGASQSQIIRLCSQQLNDVARDVMKILREGYLQETGRYPNEDENNTAYMLIQNRYVDKMLRTCAYQWGV